MSNQQQSANKCNSLYPYLTLVYTVTKSCRKDYPKKKGRKVNTGYRETSLLFFFFWKLSKRTKMKVFWSSYLIGIFFFRKGPFMDPIPIPERRLFQNYYCNFPICIVIVQNNCWKQLSEIPKLGIYVKVLWFSKFYWKVANFPWSPGASPKLT